MKIERVSIFPFPVAEVYAAWISPDTVISPAKRMNVEPFVGGRYQLFMGDDGTTAANDGRFLEVVPEKRLRYSWEWYRDGEVSEICVTFEPVPEGTKIHLVHEGFVKPESVAMHDSGWESYFAGLSAFIAARSGSDPQ